MQRNSCHNDSCFSIISSGEDINITSNDCEIQVDITARRMKSVVIWGYVVDCNNRPIEKALVKLLQYTDVCSGELRSVCYTYTDCNGFYQLDIASCSEGKYRIMASKSACSGEKNMKKHPSCQGRDEPDGRHDDIHCQMNVQNATVYCPPRIKSESYCGTKPNNIYYY